MRKKRKNMKKYKIRPIVSNSQYGEYCGLTVPKEAEKKFTRETKFEVEIQEDKIIYKSGAEKKNEK